MAEILAVGGFEEGKLAVIPEEHRTVEVRDGREATSYFKAHHGDVGAVIMSLNMRDMDGREAMEEVHRIEPEVPVIISTHTTDVSVVVDAMERGAFNYIYEPNLERELPAVLERAVRHMGAIRENRRLSALIGRRDALSRFVGISAGARAVLEVIAKVADSPSPVLFTGESGTGKEVAARVLHDLGPRSGGAFVAVNCGALAPALLEAELFGYRKGAFTGATQDRVGLIEHAEGGTLFLDELGSTDPGFQVKLLRVLENGEIRPVGDACERRVDVRIAAATNESLEEAIAEGRFRQDLYYRLSVVPVEIPPLRARREDIPVLAHHFLEGFRERYPAASVRIGPSALRCLEAYDWPGNVRELKNVIEHAILLGDRNCIMPSDLPERLVRFGSEVSFDEAEGLAAALAGAERALIRRALEKAGNNKARAARTLKVKRTTLLAKMARLGI